MPDRPRFNRRVSDLALPPISVALEWGREYAGDQGPLVDLSEWREGNRREIMGRADASLSVAQRLARTAGVLTVPGACFGADQEAFLRIAFANADVDAMGGLAVRLSAMA
ncbi:MAG TPA: hypothetical protein VKA32_00525 [Gammaproteobacteria bacterium]|nr:hypothetical protein [Gammaproteobacteria bacterium]